MGSLAPPPISKKAEVIRRMFASVARRYDLLNTLLSGGADARWRRQAAAAVMIARDSAVVDLCTGTGKLAAELCKRCPAAQVIGMDFCPEMLSLARRNNDASFTLVCADALCLPLKASSCDLIAVAFGVRNFADLRAGLREIHRCLRGGGAILILEFFLPAGGPFTALYRFYLGRILPFLGQRVSGAKDAYVYLRDSIAGFVSPAELSDLMAEAGFQRISYRLLTGGILAIHTGRKGPGLQTLDSRLSTPKGA